MCHVCSRRGLIAGAAATLILGSAMSNAAESGRRIACGFKDVDLSKLRNSMTSRSGDPQFDRALIVELRRILRFLPVEPGFQYVDADNAFALPETIVPNTKGTVLIGLKLVQKLARQDVDGGVAVAGVLAHECAHIFQFFSSYYERLKGQTQILLELHADFLAGYYMAKRRGFAPDKPGIFAKAIIQESTYGSGHGDPGQRNAAMDKGYALSKNGKTFEEAASEGERYVRNL